MRSDIVHGDFPIFHPQYGETDSGFETISSHYWNIARLFDKGVAVVIAILQDLIKNDSSEYRFEERVDCHRLS
jgi:hypothetical protein